jgi:hypothetical protein
MDTDSTEALNDYCTSYVYISVDGVVSSSLLV